MPANRITSTITLDQRFRAFFQAPALPIDLAVMRVVVFGALFAVGFGDPNDVRWYASLPDPLLQPPPGWTPFFDLIPRSVSLAAALRLVFLCSCACAVVGFKTRMATTAAVLSGLYVLGLPQSFGKLNHYHHLWWFALILAVAPCADALAVDRWLNRRKNNGARDNGTASNAYGLPLRLIWVLIGLIYFFPGIWKLVSVGLSWALTDNLKWLLYQKWFELEEFEPLLRIDHFPTLLVALGLFTIIFEVGFLPALFFPRIRWCFLLAGLAFHLGTWATMNIHFLELVVCYVAFVPIGALLPAATPNEGAVGPVKRHNLLPVRTVGIMLTFLLILAGVTGVDSWPIAVYPRFNYLAPDTATDLTIENVDSSGASSEYDSQRLAQRLHPSRWGHLQRRLSSTPVDQPQWQAFHQTLSSHAADQATHLRYWRTERLVDPSLNGEIVSRELLAELEIVKKP